MDKSGYYKNDYFFAGLDGRARGKLQHARVLGNVANGGNITFTLDEDDFDENLPPDVRVYTVTGFHTGAVGAAVDISLATLGSRAQVEITIDGKEYTFDLEAKNGTDIANMAAATPAEISTALNNLATELNIDHAVHFDITIATTAVIYMPKGNGQNYTVQSTGGSAEVTIFGGAPVAVGWNDIVYVEQLLGTDYTMTSYTASTGVWLGVNASGARLIYAVKVSI